MREEHGERNAGRCGGCGIKLQSEHKDQPGYVPAQAIEKEIIICQRCFRIKNYNESSSITVEQDEFLRLLSQIGGKEALVIHIVDIFDFQGASYRACSGSSATIPYCWRSIKPTCCPR